LRACSERRAYAAGADHEDLHTGVLPDRAVRAAACP
jgi:hypothetical protein